MIINATIFFSILFPFFSLLCRRRPAFFARAISYPRNDGKWPSSGHSTRPRICASGSFWIPRDTGRPRQTLWSWTELQSPESEPGCADHFGPATTPQINALFSWCQRLKLKVSENLKQQQLRPFLKGTFLQSFSLWCGFAAPDLGEGEKEELAMRQWQSCGGEGASCGLFK